MRRGPAFGTAATTSALPRALRPLLGASRCAARATRAARARGASPSCAPRAWQRHAPVRALARDAPSASGGKPDAVPNPDGAVWAGGSPPEAPAGADARARVAGGGAETGGVGGGGGGAGDARGGGGDDGEGAPEAALRDFGRAGEELQADVRALAPAELAAYLEATRNGFVRFLARVWPGWRRRVAADPKFPFKVLMEETVGLGLAASGMIAARGKDILNELDFAICDIAVGGTLNFILVYLLTPSIARAATGPGGAAVVSKSMFAGFNSALSRLPANMFSAGSFSIAQRLGSFMYKGSLFAVCGFIGSLVGTSLSQMLVAVRHAVSSEKDEKARELPNVAVNSAAWAGFMLVSSNPRYQTVAGLERVLFTFAPEAVAKVGSGGLRAANNVLGGAIWVWWARAIGLQEKPAKD